MLGVVVFETFLVMSQVLLFDMLGIISKYQKHGHLESNEWRRLPFVLALLLGFALTR